MTDKAKTKTILSLICNCVIFFVTTGIFISYFFVKTKLIQSGWQSLRFFTTDSNLLTAVAAALVAVCDIQKLRGKRTDIAKPGAGLRRGDAADRHSLSHARDGAGAVVCVVRVFGSGQKNQPRPVLFGLGADGSLRHGLFFAGVGF